ncbi:uncharacterized protein LOC100210397 isoform X1 [Hydra vulgaris]|uniref:uncharacterized protein LOC100210397 isoform X1 n=1 Tax=Hydra vulgaris TaxID=6087 RepID=UPI001F5F2415|nr:uncharacterized protein LOC100210397 isoform X1 [Hydra vulgaris]
MNSVCIVVFFLTIIFAEIQSVLLGCTNDSSTNFQLTASGYHVESNVSCLSVCNFYTSPVFFYAFFLEGLLCFCRNASLSQLNISNFNSPCVTSTCLIDTAADCLLSNYEVLPLSLGIVEWNITFYPSILLVDNEIQIKTNILIGDASSAYVIPIANDLLPNVQTINGTTVKTHFYLPGLQLWSQVIGSAFTNPFVATSWIQVDEMVGDIYIVPSLFLVNGYNFFILVISQGTNMNVTLSHPMKKNLFYYADIMRLAYGFDLPLIYTSSGKTCNLSGGFILKQVVLTSGYLTKVNLKVSDAGTLEIAILRPICSNSTVFCSFTMKCAEDCFTINLLEDKVDLLNISIITALVVTRYLFMINDTGIIEIPIQNKNNIQENDMVWIGGTSSLFCNGTNHEKVGQVDVGKTITFYSNNITNNDFFISLFISKPFECLIPILSNITGILNFTVEASNHIPSFQQLNYSFNFQVPVSGLRFAPKKPFSKLVAGYRVNEWITLAAEIDYGSDVIYTFSIPLLNYSKSVFNDNKILFMFTDVGVYTIYLTAANKFNFINTSVDVAVLSEISKLYLFVEKNQQQTSAFKTTIQLFNGSNVQLIVDFGDGTPVINITKIDATGVNGFTYTVIHMYFTCNVFTINASASIFFANSKGSLDTALVYNSTDVTVFCLLSPLNVITNPVISLNKKIYLSLSKNIILNINQNKGSYMMYLIDWGDGTYEIENQTMNQNPVPFQIQHKYNNENNYTVNVTCYNLLQNSSFLVQIVVKNCSVPEVSFFYGTITSPINIFRSIGGGVTAFVENINSFCKPESYNFKWNLASSTSNTSVNGFLSQQKVTYSIKKNSLDIGFYILTLQYNYGHITNFYAAYINIVFSPLYMEIDNGFFSSIAHKKKIGNDTLYQNFTISAKSSYDPDDPTIGTQKISFNWKCKIASNFSYAQEIMANFKSLNFTYLSDTCFDQNWISIPSINSEVSFSTQQFLEGIRYHVKVCGIKIVGKDFKSSYKNKTGCFTQELQIIAGGLPTISVRCISNCDSKLNFKDRVIYSYFCEDCGSQRLTAKWMITDDAGDVPSEILSPNATTTGFLIPSLVINKDILLENKKYTFTLEVGFSDSLKRLLFNFTKITCSQPSSGVCYINPTDGYALETYFKLVCYNWIDLDGFLSYKFFYDTNHLHQMKLSSTTTVDYPMLNAATTDQPSLIDFVMGPGDENNDYKIKIIIKVYNKYNAYKEYNQLIIKVQPSNKPINLTALLARMHSNDTQSIANVVQAVSSATNLNSSTYSSNTLTPLNMFTNMVDIDAINLQKQQELSYLQKSRTEMITLLSNAPVEDMSSFKSLGDALVLVSHNPIELVPKTQEQAANIITKLADLLTKENLKLIGADSFDTMTQPFVNSISNLFKANFDYNIPGDFPIIQTTASTSLSNLESSENIVTKLLKSLENYFIAAHSYKVPGENTTIGETKQFSFVLKKDFLSDFSNTQIGSIDGGFTLPDFIDMFNESIQNTQVLINNIRMKLLAYTWDVNRSQNILSETQSLSISDVNGDPIKVSNSSQPINITIKNIPEKMNGKIVSLSMPNDVYQIKFPLKSDCNMLLKFVFKNDPSSLTNLIVYIQYGKVASKLDYDIMLNISVKFGVIMTKYNVSLNTNSSFLGVSTTNATATDSKNIFSKTIQRNQVVRLLDDGTLVLWNFLNSTYAFLNKSKLHLSFSYVGPMPDKKFNVNPYTFDEAEFNGTFDYEVKSFCAECNYWNEVAKKWMSDGCHLDVQRSTFFETQCKCNHLTAFGGFFVAPNPIPTPSLAMLKHGYVLLVTVAVIILLWILGLIITRKMDKKDISKIGVCPLLDNQSDNNYLYQIVVNTGSRRNAGTKSNIFFKVFGDINDSGIRRLKDGERECFQRSSCDVFIMTTHTTLGDLDFIHLWHDNSGGGWYLRNIIIIDLQTEKQFLFIGHRWIAVDRGLCTLDCVIPVASAEETSNFSYIFKTKAENDFSDAHLWFSIFARPPKSNFTRSQRLSVAVSLLMTSMVASSMFYDSVPPANPSVENKIGSFSFTWAQVYIAIISCLVTIPINLILVGFFRSIKPFENIIKENSKKVLYYNKVQEESSLKLIEKKSNKETTAVLIKENKSSLIKMRKEFNLPHWCLYIAWFICICSIFACGFVVILYGMSFGNNKSLNWLSSVTIGFIQDILFTQPIKIFFLSIFVALIRKNIEEETCEVEKQGKLLAHDESWLYKSKDEPTIFEQVNIELKPLDFSLVIEMREKGFKKMKMCAITQELFLYTTYAFLVFFIGYMTRENVAFYQTRNVEELFNLRLRPGVSYPGGKVFNSIQSLQDFWPWMEEFFLPQVYPEPWFNLSDFYANNTDKKNFPGKLFLNDLTSKVVNGIRIRQIRVQPHSCIKAVFIADYVKQDCLSRYNPGVEETRDFDFDWTLPKKYKSLINPSTMPWRYQTWQELDGYPYAADLDTYYGGGYVIEIFPKWKNQAILDQAKNFRWIDRQTRAIIIEFALFNAATSYFNMVTMVLEFSASGGAVPNFFVLTFKLYASTKETGIAMFGSQILFILMMLVFTVRECRFLYRTGSRYFLEFWNLVEVALILISVAAVGFFFYKDHLAKVLLERLPSKKPQSFINFQFASYWDLMYIYIVSLIVFFVTLKFIKVLRFNRRVSMLSSTLKAAWYPLSMFGIVFFIILCSIVFSTSIVFGLLLDGYQNHFKTVASIISLLLGKFSYSQFENAHSFLGPIFFFGFNVMVNWIIMNMFVSILNDVFGQVRKNLKYQNNDYEMVDFIMAFFKDWLGWYFSKEEKVILTKDIEVIENNNFLSVSSIIKSKLNMKQIDTKFNKVKKEMYYDVDSKKTILEEKFSKYNYLLNEDEPDGEIDVTLNRFVNCMNVLYFDDETLVNKMNEFVKMEMEK